MFSVTSIPALPPAGHGGGREDIADKIADAELRGEHIDGDTEFRHAVPPPECRLRTASSSTQAPTVAASGPPSSAGKKAAGAKSPRVG